MLESKIEALTLAVQQLTAVLQAQNVAQTQAAPVAYVPPAAAVPAAPTGAVVAPPTSFAEVPVQPAQPVAATMPPPPSFVAPAPAPAAAGPTAPFTDSNGLIKYATDSYFALGESKGPALQNIIASLGHASANDIRPDQYGQFYALVEQLKVS